MFGRRTLMVVCGLGVAGAVAYLAGPQPQYVDTAQVKSGEMIVTADSEGRTRIPNVYAVPASVTGYMQRISLKPGDQVQEGTVITRILPVEPDLLTTRSKAAQEARIKNAEATLEQAVADRDRAKAALQNAEAEMARQTELRSRGVASAKTAETALLNLKTKEAELVASEKSVVAKQAQLDVERASMMAPSLNIRSRTADERHVEVTSPIAGKVLKVVRESEDIVNMGSPLVEIGDPSDLEIILEMLSTDAVKVKVGAIATIDGWGGNPLKARVRKMEPAGFTKVSALGVEEQRVVVVLDFLGPREVWGTLSHGYRVNAKIVVWEKPNAVTVPTGALFRRNNRWMAYVVVNGAAALRPVEIGETNSVDAEVKSGLAVGDTVILHPSDTISDGALVKPREQPPVPRAVPQASGGAAPEKAAAFPPEDIKQAAEGLLNRIKQQLGLR